MTGSWQGLEGKLKAAWDRGGGESRLGTEAGGIEAGN